MAVIPPGFNVPDDPPAVVAPDTPPDVCDSQAPPPPLPAGAYDVSQVSPSDISALERDPDRQKRQLGFTIENAKINYADMINRGERVVVTTSAGNGGQPVVALVPPGFDPCQPARVNTHYHGFNSTVADPKGAGSGQTARIEDVQAQDPQTIFILPECKNVPTERSVLDPSKGNYNTDWSNVSDEAQTTNDALAACGVTNVGTRVVSAHSGGGAALAAAIHAQPDGSGLQCDHLELLDCLYGSEVAIANWGKTANGQAADVAYYHGTNDHSDAGIKAVFGSRYHRTNVSYPKPADNPIVYDAAGNPIKNVRGQVMHKFNSDAHNFTNGAYMDSTGR
jgi:hypothetical protein